MRSAGVDFDGRRDGALQVGDAAGRVAVQPPDDHDAGVVRLIAVVQDEIVARCVVPHISDVGIRAVRLADQ